MDGMGSVLIRHLYREIFLLPRKRTWAWLVRCGSFVWFWGTVSRAGPPSPTGTSKVSGIPGLNFVVVLGHVSYFTP